jgi:hypothetical protein
MHLNVYPSLQTNGYTSHVSIQDQTPSSTYKYTAFNYGQIPAINKRLIFAAYKLFQITIVIRLKVSNCAEKEAQEHKIWVKYT